MAKGDPLSSQQQKIVDRYYDNLDTGALQRLQELVSEIYLIEPGPKKDKLWRTAETHLKKFNLPAAVMERVLGNQDVKQLAQLVAEIAARKPGASAAPPARPTTPSPVLSTTSLPPAAPAVTAASGAPAATAAAGVPAVPGAGASATRTFTPEELKSALKTFKKRLKLTKLDEESRLGRNPLSGGKGSGIFAITPPNQYPIAVWEELVKQGRLKAAGRGFYQLADGEG